MIKLNAYAKVNLLLKILNKRPDGYHEIESIMQEISLHDGILLESNESESIDIININENKDEEVPWNEKNLAYKAAKIFKETFDIKSGLTIKINKNIPTSAGLGGGSSDAAATLIGVSRLWKTNLPKDRLAKIGEKIGSDVPFFLYGKTALVTGKGENVSPILSLPKTWFILVKPKISISTKWAYENFDLKPKHSESPDTNEMVELMQKGSKEKFFKLLYNDFERIVYKNYPSLKAIKDLLLDLGADNSLLSGSGSVIFGISSTYEKAQEIYNKIIPYNLGKVYICNSI